MISSVSNSLIGLLGSWHSRIAQLAAFVVLGVGTPLYAATLYVDGALSADCPSTNYSLVSRDCRGGDGPGYATFASAVAAMRPGDTMAIRGGTYRRPLVVTRSGTASAHLRFAAYAGERVVIDLAGVVDGPVLSVGGHAPLGGIDTLSKSFLDFEGLTIYNAPFEGLRGISSSDITITDCEFAYSYHAGIGFEGGANITITRSRIHHSQRTGGTGHEAVTFQGVNHFSITDSEVYENGKEGIDAKYGSTGGVIARNHVYRNAGPNIYLDGATSIDVVGNICHDVWASAIPNITRKGCIGLGIEATANNRVSTRDIAIYNNVMYGSGAGIVFWAAGDALSWARFENIRIEHNTIVDNDNSGIFFINGTPWNFGSGNTIRNNIIIGFYSLAFRDVPPGYGTPVLQLFTIDHNVFQSGENSATFGSNAVMTTTSPFVNRPGRDFHVVAGSPARTAVPSIPDISTDIEGHLRPSGTTDAGAYQSSTTTTGNPPAPTLPPRPATNVSVVR